MPRSRSKTLLSDQIKSFLFAREFIYIATSMRDGRPNVAPKFLLSIEANTLFLADYVRNRTFLNLQVNPRVSLSALDQDSLRGYQLNGKGTVLSHGPLYARLKGVFEHRQLTLSTQRIIDGVRAKKAHASFEMVFPEQIAIFRIHIEEVVVIHPNGVLEQVS